MGNGGSPQDPEGMMHCWSNGVAGAAHLSRRLGLGTVVYVMGLLEALHLSSARHWFGIVIWGGRTHCVRTATALRHTPLQF